MREATFDFSTSWTVELSSLWKTFGIWCFHWLYLMTMCGIYHVLLAELEYEELWLRDAIKRKMVDLILWNLMAKHQRQLKIGLTFHLASSSLE